MEANDSANDVCAVLNSRSPHHSNQDIDRRGFRGEDRHLCPSTGNQSLYDERTVEEGGREGWHNNTACNHKDHDEKKMKACITFL